MAAHLVSQAGMLISNHGITQAGKTSKVIDQPLILRYPYSPLYHNHKCHSQMSFENFSGQLVSVIYQNFSIEIFPNIQSKIPLVQFEAITSHPIACYLAEETDFLLPLFFLQPPFKELQRAIRAPSEAPFPQSKHPHLPQIVFIQLVLQICPHLLLLFSGHIPTPQYLPCSEGSKTTDRIQGALLSSQSRERCERTDFRHCALTPADLTKQG